MTEIICQIATELPERCQNCDPCIMLGCDHVGYRTARPMEEIVRCKDCKHYRAGWCSSWYPSYPKHPTLERLFCAWGERR